MGKEWERLRSDCGGGIFSSHHMVMEWLKAFHEMAEPRFLCMEREGSLVAIAPFVLGSKRHMGLKVKTLYMVPRVREGRVILGATVEETGYDVRPTAGGIDQLLQGGIRLFPDLADAGIVEMRVGLRPGTPDGIPILGKTPLDGLLLASGPFRKGILLAPVISDIVSRLAAGEDPGVPMAPYSVTRFRT